MPAFTPMGASHIKSSLPRAGLFLPVGPVVYHIKSKLPVVAEGLSTLYADYPKSGSEDFSDHAIGLSGNGVLRTHIKPEVRFRYDHTFPFGPMTPGQAYALLEWGMNWCIAIQHNEYLKIHAAVLAKNGRAIVMPGAPGAGKSTLSAALLLRGWRLLSDEHALIEPGRARVVPLCRPVSLKNESIEIIEAFEPRSTFGPVSLDTHKGRVAHLKSDLHLESHDLESLVVSRIIFPRFVPAAEASLSPMTRAETFMRAAEQSFNYSLLGKRGFETMRALVSACTCSRFEYSDLEAAVELFDSLDLTTE